MTPMAKLSPREREVVPLLARGLRNQEIGIQMGITRGTVKIYVGRILRTLGCRNRTEVAGCYLKSLGESS